MVIVQIALSSTTNLRSKTEIEQQYEDIWKSLFSGTRGQSCAGAALRRAVLASARARALQIVKGIKGKAGKFAWVKHWGYGPLSYFIDFMDTAVRQDVVKEFKKIYDDMRNLPSEDTDTYKDPYDLKKLLEGADSGLSKKALADLKLVNKNYDPKIYDISVNCVQIRQGMNDWRWSIDFPTTDYAKLFLQKYDMNGDGRLAPRELVLGALDNNKHLFGSGSCTHCFEEVSRKINAIFTYIDCDNDGIITAEDLWHNIPGLRRSSPEYNMFALGELAGIRTAAVNDFVLVNGVARRGVLNKNEFTKGILFAMWDRQTDFTRVLEDDELTLKDLRWKNNHMVDVRVEDYITALMVRDLKEKEHRLG
jgi:hypothetical protein